MWCSVRRVLLACGGLAAIAGWGPISYVNPAGSAGDPQIPRGGRDRRRPQGAQKSMDRRCGWRAFIRQLYDVCDRSSHKSSMTATTCASCRSLREGDQPPLEGQVGHKSRRCSTSHAATERQRPLRRRFQSARTGWQRRQRAWPTSTVKRSISAPPEALQVSPGRLCSSAPGSMVERHWLYDNPTALQKLKGR